MSFTADIARFADKAKLSHDEAVVAVCSKLTTLVIEKTPVDSGRAQGNYYANIDSYSSATSDSRTESEAMADGLSKARQASGKIFTLTNNLPYILKLEYGLYSGSGTRTINGFSTQAPAGMARISIAETANELKKG